ncbi:hydroxyacid dehydrogenase [Devosia sp. 2618]|uniref:hydroxyacid dehydrogenase n=1 Tax=Devosia sp. 2618 TaxID=3156454 RepID=UPI0033972438
MAFDDTYRRQVFGSAEEAALGELVLARPIDLSRPDFLGELNAMGISPSDVRVLITGWPTPKILGTTLAALPNLGLIAHSGGTVKSLLPDGGLSDTIAVSSCTSQNAIPVAEFTLATILLSNKRILDLARTYSELKEGRDAVLGRYCELGNYRRVVGLVGASTIGRLVAKLLQPFDLTVLIADPYLSAEEAAEMGVEKVSLDALFERSDCISLHAPLLPETHNLVDAKRINSMKPGATLINTARGALVDQAALIDALQRDHIQAVVDTTWPEVPDGDSPLWSLPNLLLTPHIAGSGSTELHRHGNGVISAIRAFLQGEAVPGRVELRQLDRIA